MFILRYKWLVLDSVIKTEFDKRKGKEEEQWALKNEEGNAVIVSNHLKIFPKPGPNALL